MCIIIIINLFYSGENASSKKTLCNWNQTKVNLNLLLSSDNKDNNEAEESINVVIADEDDASKLISMWL